MRTVRIVQTVALMLVVALAASCEASKAYTSKLFTPRNQEEKPVPPAAVLRFLETESNEKSSDDWVTTDIIMGRDTLSNTLALDKLIKMYPAKPIVKPAAVDSSTISEKKSRSIIAEAKPVPKTEVTVARNYDPTEVRSKKTREE